MRARRRATTGKSSGKRKLASCERELAKWFQALPEEEQRLWLRLLRILTRAEKRGDEFTWRRFMKLATPGWDINTVLPEMDRPLGRRIRRRIAGNQLERASASCMRYIVCVGLSPPNAPAR